MEINEDYRYFQCAYPPCARRVTGFIFRNEKDRKFCSAFCRRKAEEDRKAAIHQREMADETDRLNDTARP